MPTVFVDLDLTLVHTRQLKLLAKCRTEENHFWYGRRRFAATSRPGAQEFLSTLSEHYDVHILTYGNSKFQRRVLKEVGLLHCISQIYGVDNWHVLDKPDRFVLIDDMPRNSILIRHKMDWLGKNKYLMSERDFEEVLDKHHIQCSAFDGSAAVESLSELLPRIHRYLE